MISTDLAVVYFILWPRANDYARAVEIAVKRKSIAVN